MLTRATTAIDNREITRRQVYGAKGLLYCVAATCRTTHDNHLFCLTRATFRRIYISSARIPAPHHGNSIGFVVVCALRSGRAQKSAQKKCHERKIQLIRANEQQSKTSFREYARRNCAQRTHKYGLADGRAALAKA